MAGWGGRWEPAGYAEDLVRVGGDGAFGDVEEGVFHAPAAAEGEAVGVAGEGEEAGAREDPVVVGVLWAEGGLVEGDLGVDEAGGSMD